LSFAITCFARELNADWNPQPIINRPEMLAITFSDITTSGAVGVIILVFVVCGFIKGLVRMSCALVALAGGMLAGLWGFKNGASIAGTVISDPDPWMSAAVGIILGLATFFVARALFSVVLSPVGAKDGKAKRLGLPGGLLGFLMGASFAWFCLSGVRYIGTLSELDWLRTSISEENKIKDVAQPLFSKLKRGLDVSTPGQLHEKFDFLNDRARANLAKLTVLVSNTFALNKAAVDPDVRAAIKQTQINLMLLEQSSTLKSYYEEGQFSQLLHSNNIKDLCKEDAVDAALVSLDIEKALGLLKEEEKEKPEEEEKK
jgi:hypothetical protein